MFKRIMMEDWTLFVPIISFCIFFAVFLAVTIRTLRIRKSESDRLASLPLDNAARSHHPDKQPDN
jgi:hypothetical protein